MKKSENALCPRFVFNDFLDCEKGIKDIICYIRFRLQQQTPEWVWLGHGGVTLGRLQLLAHSVALCSLLCSLSPRTKPVGSDRSFSYYVSALKLAGHVLNLLKQQTKLNLLSSKWCMLDIVSQHGKSWLTHYDSRETEGTKHNDGLQLGRLWLKKTMTFSTWLTGGLNSIM